MSGALAQYHHLAGLAFPAEMVESMRDTLTFQVSKPTRRVYEHDFAEFSAWCSKHRFPALPTNGAVLAAYCEYRATTKRDKYAYICRGLAAIAAYHNAAGADNPRKTKEVALMLKSIRNRYGVKQRKATPLLVNDLKAVLRALPNNAKGIRDRAVLLVGFLAAMRRSEIADIRIEDVSFVPQGALIHMPKSKTDQEGRGQFKPIPYTKDPELCAVTALRNWIEFAGITQGYVFLVIHSSQKILPRRFDGRAINAMLQRACARAGMRSNERLSFTGHSLRAGFVTQGIKRKVTTHSIMKQTGHKSRNSMEGYIRDATLWDDNAVMAMGL